MLRKHMAACLVASALAVVPALAQTTGPGSAGGGGAGGTAGPGPAPQPGAAGGGTGGTAGGGGVGTPGNFIDRQQPGQVLASRQLMGTTVVGPNNERIGDVNDILLDRNGQAVAIIIGVGGFLGIGEKDVAVSFNQVQFTPRDQGTGAGGGAGGAGAGGASGSAGPRDQIMIRMSKQDLQNAPTFARAGDTGGGGAGGTDAGGTTRPSGTGAGGGGAGVGGTPGPSPK